MPFYGYQCPKCGEAMEEFSVRAEGHTQHACGACGVAMEPDYTPRITGKPTGDLPDQVSRFGLGVHPCQVDRANREWAHLDVKFDPKTGNAHVPGKNRTRFIKERGLVEL